MSVSHLRSGLVVGLSRVGLVFLLTAALLTGLPSQAGAVAGYGDVPKPVCAALQVAPSTYWSATRRPPSARALRDAKLMPLLLVLWQANYSVYGSRKLWYTDAVQWSQDDGIANIAGFCFGPDTGVSRGETAVWSRGARKVHARRRRQPVHSIRYGERLDELGAVPSHRRGLH